MSLLKFLSQFIFFTTWSRENLCIWLTLLLLLMKKVKRVKQYLYTWRLLFGNLIFWEFKIPTRSPYTRYLFLLIPSNTSNLAEQNNSSKFALNLYLSVICLTVPTSLQNLFLCLSRVNLNNFSSKLKNKVFDMSKKGVLMCKGVLFKIPG